MLKFTGAISGALAILLASAALCADSPEPRTYERDNPSAEDLLDHWNRPEPLTTALGLWSVDEAESEHRIGTGVDLLRAVGNDSTRMATRLRNVRAEDMEVVGQKAGITYARWKGGPAGTLNIEFDWRFAQDFDAEARARMERAGKSWSWRILDDFGQHVLESGKRLWYRSTKTRRRETLGSTYLI